MKFIQINGRILDYGQYRKNCNELQRLLVEDIASVARMYGFELIDEELYNEAYDLELTIVIKKKSPSKFV